MENVAENRTAFREFEISQKLEAGISLIGCEVKSCREGGMNLKESYVRIQNKEAYLLNCQISPYKYTNDREIDPLRERKLLLNRAEILKLNISLTQKGLTIIPLRAYFKNGKIKLEIGVGKGKKLHDKRDAIKDRENKRKIQRIMKG